MLCVRAREGRRVLPSVVIGLAVIVLPCLAHAAGEERFELDIGAARQIDRFQSRQADSLGLSRTDCTVGIAKFDFRVLDIPAGKVRPSMHVFGEGTTVEHVFVAPPIDSTVGPTTEQAAMYELSGGAGFEVPLGLVDKTEGASFLIYYEGAVYVLRGTGDNFMQRSMVYAGFELTSGRFAGSRMVVGNGHDDLYGPVWSSGRWAVTSRLMAGIGREKKPGPGAPKMPGRRPLRAFLDLTINTDDKAGPDSITMRAGLTLDAATTLTRILGALRI